jgi:hypothetical protein
MLSTNRVKKEKKEFKTIQMKTNLNSLFLK